MATNPRIPPARLFSLEHLSIEVVEHGERVLRDCRQQITEAAAMVEANRAIRRVNKRMRRRLRESQKTG